ncbi:MAG: hypothetical protein M1838_006081 [Thelocarpon superellum]|nr:MAG: hypothetical protein M1838_006081 [Thelocarpon superellum]
MSFVLPLLILLSPKPFSNQSGDPSGNASAFVWQHWWWLLLVDVLFIVNLFVVLSNIVPNRIGRRTHERASYIVLYLWPWVLTIIIWVFWCLILRGAWSLGGKAETELRSKLHWLGAYSIAVIVTGGLLLILRLIIPFQGGLFTPFMRARHIYACALPSIAIVTINIMWFLTLRFIGLMNGRRVFQGDNAWTMDEFNGTLKVMGPLVAVCLVLNWASLVVYVEGTLQLYQLLSKSRDTPEAHASPDLERAVNLSLLIISYRHSKRGIFDKTWHRRLAIAMCLLNLSSLVNLLFHWGLIFSTARTLTGAAGEAANWVYRSLRWPLFMLSLPLAIFMVVAILTFAPTCQKPLRLIWPATHQVKGSAYFVLAWMATLVSVHVESFRDQPTSLLGAPLDQYQVESGVLWTAATFMFTAVFVVAAIFHGYEGLAQAFAMHLYHAQSTAGGSVTPTNAIELQPISSPSSSAGMPPGDHIVDIPPTNITTVTRGIINSSTSWTYPAVNRPEDAHLESTAYIEQYTPTNSFTSSAAAPGLSASSLMPPPAPGYSPSSSPPPPYIRITPSPSSSITTLSGFVTPRSQASSTTAVNSLASEYAS